MTGATMFSGIRAPEVAMPWVTWKWAADIEKFPNSVGRKHFKHVPNLGDVSAPDFIDRAKSHGPIDLLVFGSPCQSYSVAGKRLGLDDPRGNLALVALRIIDALRPRWFLFENVPGLLSSGERRDYGALLGTVADIGYYLSARVLDAQYYGVPQRRRRIFALGHSRDWRYPAAILFEPESLSRNFAPRDEKRKGSAKPAVKSVGYRRFWRSLVGAFASRVEGVGAGGVTVASLTRNPYADNESQESKLVAMCLNAKNNRFDGESQTFVTATLDASYGRLQGCSGQDANHGHSHLVAHSLRADGFDASEDGTGCGTPLVAVLAPTLDQRSGRSGQNSFATSGGLVPVAFQEAQTGVREYASSGTLRSNGPGHDPVGTRIRQGMAVRRLTPIECARLQGFPDTFCHIYRNKKRKITPETAAYYRSHGLKCFLRDGQWFTLVAADGPIYKAYGNSMAIPCLVWIGDRLRQLEERAS